MRHEILVFGLVLGAAPSGCSDQAAQPPLVACNEDDDCTAVTGAARCADGLCVDVGGTPVHATPAASGASGATATGGSGGSPASGGGGAAPAGSDACPGCEAVCTCNAPTVPRGCTLPDCDCPTPICDGSGGASGADMGGDGGASGADTGGDGGASGAGTGGSGGGSEAGGTGGGGGSEAGGTGGGSGTGGGGTSGTGGALACPDCKQLCCESNAIPAGCPVPRCDCTRDLCVDACTGVAGWGLSCSDGTECPGGEVCCASGAACMVTRCIAAEECPACTCRCNSPDTPIATPDGEVPIAELREGDLVLSVHRGEVVAVPVLRVHSLAVRDHAVVRLELDSGRAIEVSGSHPTADGRRLDSLAVGDRLGDARVVGVSTVPYAHERTFDILPASDTGNYFAAGALLGSTLR